MSAKSEVRLRFNTSKPRLPSKLIHVAAVGPVLEVHRQISGAEEENAGTEAGHKAEEATEMVSCTGQSIHRSRKLKSRQKAVSVGKKLSQSKISELQRKPGAHSLNTTTNAVSRWQQKQAIKKEYMAVRSGTSTKTTKSVLETVRRGGRKATSVVGKIAAIIVRHPKGLLIVLSIFLIVAMMMYSLSSCSQMFLGSLNAFISTSYTADDSEICAVDLAFTRLEAELKYNIQNAEREHPGYDEYRYSIGHIGHDPYMLLAYLTARYEGFTFGEVNPELESIYSAMYSTTFRGETEVRYRTETRTYNHTVIDPVTSESSIQIETYEVSVSYDYHILNVSLESNQLSFVLYPRMSVEQREMYQVYMDTKGNKVSFGNPFSFNWQSQVTSMYGWRVHPISHNLQLHRGLDIAEPQGTPIQSVHTGKVVQVGYDSDGFGNYVAVEDKDGYRSTYAHCASINVREGQAVALGEMIATVGNTGVSTGSHLHLELSYRSEYLNPYFFIGFDDP